MILHAALATSLANDVEINHGPFFFSVTKVIFIYEITIVSIY